MKRQSIVRAGGATALAVLIGLVATFLAYGVTQEVPIGSLTGTVVMVENGKPLANAAVILRPKSNDDLGSARVRFIRADKNGKFSARNLPAALYEVEVSAVAHQLPKTNINVEEGAAKELALRLDPIDPYLTLYANQHVFMPKEEPAVQVHGFVEAKALDVRLYQVPISELIKDKDFYATFSPIARATTPEILQKSNPAIKMVQRFQWPIVPNDAEGTFKRQLALPRLKPGFYFLRLQAGEATKERPVPAARGTYLLVTDLGIVAKRAKGKLHVFASNLESGAPIPNVPVTFAQGTRTDSVGSTNEEGLLTTDLPQLPRNTSAGTAVVAQLGESAAVVTFNDYSGDPDDMRMFVTTDRPIYRPGDSVSFRAIARKPDGARYMMPSETVGSYEIQDLESRVIKRGSGPMTSFGTFSGDFTLPEGSTEGVRLILKVGSAEVERYINVAAYRKPEFKITATPVKPYYLRGETVQMKVKCEYYFGGPVVGAKLTGSVGKSPLWAWTDPDTGEEESWEDYGDGEYLADLEGVTDPNGEALLSYNSTELKWGTWENVDQNLTFSVFGTEGDDRYFESKGSVKLLQGDITLRTDQDRWVVSPGQEAEIKFQLSTPEFGSDAIAGRKINIETGYEVWDAKGSVFTPELRTSVVTDKAGFATLKVKPSNPGDFRIRASTTDRRGATVQSSAWLYCYQDGFAMAGPQPDLQITLDKKSYLPGETVTALIRSKAKGGSAWVTLETDEIKEQRVVPIESGMTSVQFPVTAALKPNAFLTVSLIREKQFSSAQRRLTVKLTDEKLNLEVTSDKKEYKPGETATYRIKATKFDGTPARAEVALGVVDEAIYAIAEDDSDPIEAFYPVRSSLISTYNSFPELYLDGGDKGESDVEIRDNFVDTATWMPHVVTDANGVATATIKLPDNLTSWRATATAVTAETSVGKVTQNLTVRKDLMVRLATPMYLTQLDRTTVTANLNNGTDQPFDVKVSLAATGLKITDGAEKSIRLEAGKGGQVTWLVEAEQAGEATLEVVARGPNSLSDGMRVTVPIVVHGRAEVVGASGELDSVETVIKINRDPTANRGSLVITASPSLAAPIIGTIESLVDFPYGCAEQTMSRFVPAAIADQVLRELNIAKPELSKKIESVTREAMARIRSMQSSDGGWGWFGTETAQPYTTAIVLEGFARIRQAGQPTDRIVVDNGLDWARRWPRSDAGKKASPEDRVTIAATIMRFEKSPEAIAALVAVPLEWRDAEAKQTYKLQTESLAQIVVALTGVEAGNARRAEAARRLWAEAKVREDSITWPDSWGVRNTSRALEAVMAMDPADSRIIKIVRGMLLMRKGAYWTSTLDSSLAIQALLPYLKRTGGLAQDAQVDIYLNGERRTAQEFGADANVGLIEVRIPISDLKAGDNEVQFTRSGTGVGFYNYVLEQTPFRTELKSATSEGLTITRTFHSLGAERMEDGTMRLLPSKTPITDIASGAPVRCIVTIESKQELSYAMVEVPLPSNLKASIAPVEESWNFWYTGINVLDDRVAFFARTIPAGKSEFELNLRAEAVGVAGVLPASVVEMYSPEMQSSTASMRFEVKR